MSTYEELYKTTFGYPTFSGMSNLITPADKEWADKYAQSGMPAYVGVNTNFPAPYSATNNGSFVAPSMPGFNAPVNTTPAWKDWQLKGVDLSIPNYKLPPIPTGSIAYSSGSPEDRNYTELLPYSMGELQHELSGAMSPIRGNSMIASIRQANAGINKLDALNQQGLVGDQYDAIRKGLNSRRVDAAVSGVATGLAAGAQLAGTAYQAAQTRGTDMYAGKMQNLADISTYSYNNYDQLANAYNQIGTDMGISKDDIRGMTTAQKIGTIGSSMLTGGSAGAAIGGPWGAAVGAGIGLLTSGIGILSGNRKAETEYNLAGIQADRARSDALLNLEATHENLADMNFRRGVVNAAAQGGKIERHQMSLTEFAEAVKNKQRVNDRTHSSGIIRRHCNGGTMIRIKMK